MPQLPEKAIEATTLTPEALDALITEFLGQSAAEPIIDDAAFLRRVSLDLTAAPPTPAQIESFVGNGDPDKRAKLVDRLLESEAFAANRARYWRDVIRYRATFENLRLIDYPSLESWLADQFRENRPWDEIARAMISGTGSTTEAGNVAFAVAHLDGRRSVRAPEFAGEVSRIFLGIQIQCAECHDHPTDPWSRRQFHEFAAFFAGTEARRLGRPGDPDFRVEVVDARRVPRYEMPDLADPARSIPVAPKFFLGEPAEVLPAGLSARQRRELAASYVTSQENPWFARAFVNRVWSELLGDAFYLPIDDLGPAREPIAPEVLDALAGQWQRGGYDIRWLYRTIMKTEAYQRGSGGSGAGADAAAFASNCPSRLRPDQIAASLARVLGGPAARDLPAGTRGREAARFARFGPRVVLDQLFGVDPSTPADEVLGTIPQALFLMNSPPLERAIAHPRGTITRILAEHPRDDDALDALYALVLSRTPAEGEREAFRAHRDEVADRREAFEDLLWSLINSAEFINRR